MTSMGVMGAGSRGGGCMYTYSWFALLHSRNQQPCKTITFPLNFKTNPGGLLLPQAAFHHISKLRQFSLLGCILLFSPTICHHQDQAFNISSLDYFSLVSLLQVRPSNPSSKSFQQTDLPSCRSDPFTIVFNRSVMPSCPKHLFQSSQYGQNIHVIRPCASPLASLCPSLP